MNTAQALAIAAAASVTAMQSEPFVAAHLYQGAAVAALVAAKLETVTSTHMQQFEFEGGFRATPDGVCIERQAGLR